MTLNLTIPEQTHTDFTPRITVIGVGGGGTNAVNNMIALNLPGVDFVVANTDAQQLVQSRADRRIQLGPHLTQGNGAGGRPEIGRAAAEEAAEELYRYLDGTHMVFITAGMGGGTGTGAAPVIARMARERNILTVGVVTKPFSFEGVKRARAADAGIDELQQYVDTLIVIPNQNLFRISNERTGWKEAFQMADNVLYMGVRGVTDLIVVPGIVNLDFADIRTVMSEMGKAMMGTGEADGENRATRAAEAAISNPLLEDTNMAGAKGLLINITGGEDLTLFEVDQAANRIKEEVDREANIIFGSAIDDSLTGRIRISVVATGIDQPVHKGEERPKLVAMEGGAAESHATVAVSPTGGRATATPGAPARVEAWPAAQQSPAVAVGSPLASAISQPIVNPQVGPQAGAVPASVPVTQPAPAPVPPVSQASAPPVTSPARPASGIFAGPSHVAAAGTNAAPTRNRLFNLVTGAIKGAQQTVTPPAGPELPRPELPRTGPVRVSMQPTMSEEMALEIPAFLRRQNS